MAPPGWPLGLRHEFTGHCKYAAILFQISVRSAGAAIYAVILLRRMLAEVPRAIFRGPSWEAPVLRIHYKYAVILLRRRLKKGPPRLGPLGPPGRRSSFFGPCCPPPGRPGKIPGGEGRDPTSTHLTSLCHDTL